MNSDSDKKEIWTVNQYPVELKSFLSGKLCNSIADGDEGYSYGELIGIGWQAATASMQEEIDQQGRLFLRIAEIINYSAVKGDLVSQVEALQAEVESCKRQIAMDTETIERIREAGFKAEAEVEALKAANESMTNTLKVFAEIRVPETLLESQVTIKTVSDMSEKILSLHEPPKTQG
jgi:hypothetical protein